MAWGYLLPSDFHDPLTRFVLSLSRSLLWVSASWCALCDHNQNAPQFVLFSLGAAFLLAKSQSQFYANHHKHLFNTRKVIAEGNQDLLEAEQQMRAAINKESTAYAVFLVNTLYLVRCTTRNQLLDPLKFSPHVVFRTSLFSHNFLHAQLAVVTLGYQILPKLGVDVPSTVNHMISSLVPAMVLFVVGKQLH